MIAAVPRRPRTASALRLRVQFGGGTTGRALLCGCLLLALAACASSAAPSPPSRVPGGEARPSQARYEAAAREWLARDGLGVARVVVVEGDAWRRAADGAGTLGTALARAGIPGVDVEPRGASFCARSAASVDCLFVTVRASDGAAPRVADVDPRQVEAVAYVEPTPPDEGDTPMAWREELRTGRLVVFVVRNPASRSFHGGMPRSPRDRISWSDERSS